MSEHYRKMSYWMGENEPKKGSIYTKSRAAAKSVWKSTWRLDAAWAALPLSAAVLAVVSVLLGTISCMLRPGVTYERFDDALKTTMSQTELAKKLTKATALLQKDEAVLDAAADTTCAIYKQVSTALIENESAPTPDMPQPLSQETQAALKARGLAKFEETKKTYLAKHDCQDMLECFAGQDEAAADETLRAAMIELDAQLAASNMKLKARKMKATLGFTGPYIEEIVKAFSDTSKEGFYGTECSANSRSSEFKKATGADLVAKGIALYNEAMKVHVTIQEQPGVAKMQKEALAAIEAKKKALENPSSEDIAHFEKEGQDPKYSE